MEAIAVAEPPKVLPPMFIALTPQTIVSDVFKPKVGGNTQLQSISNVLPIVVQPLLLRTVMLYPVPLGTELKVGTD
jgi:hypothetical protein